MPEPLSIAISIGQNAIRLLLAQRRKAAERSLSLAELINLTVLDDYKRRGLQREVAAIVDAVSERLEVYIKQEWQGLPESDRNAAILAVRDIFESFDLSDASFLAADADPVALARRLRVQGGSRTVSNLGGRAGELYNTLLDESCVLYCQLVVGLGPFVNRGVAELLARTSSLSYQADLILQRLPLRTLDAPEGETFDAEFELRYLNYISSAQDEIELFGVDVNRYLPRATLSLAYISLTASSTYRHPSTSEGGWQYNDESRIRTNAIISSSIEGALGASRRMLVLGEAGSGKTTLLSWLAVMAARGSFAEDLTFWNGRVPFVIKLRQYVDRALPAPEQFLDAAVAISDLKPRNWAHRILSSGKALLLIDGVDELPASQRRNVRNWLRDLLRIYPNTDGVVTARPTAANAGWLADEGFSSVALEQMGPDEVKALITQWHIAIRDAGNLPCPEDELPEYERSLVLKLESTPHLQSLASSPLLCAMLCALNLDRHKTLPPDRMAIYQAALNMLLERRDAERGVAVAEQPLPVSLPDKLQLLQYLAWRMSLNSKNEIDKEQAIRRFEERLTMIRSSNVDARTAVDYLVSRSGVIREPVVGRIDFVHRTFQEYLTAKEAADNSDVGFLVDRSHLDTWQQTVVMAAGHANVPTKRELFTGVLARAESEPRYSRRLRLLAAACLETAGALEPDIRRSVESCLVTLVPPRRKTEANSLAMAGSAVFAYTPADSSGMSTASAVAMISTLAKIGGEKALDILSAYSKDSRARIIDALIDASQYFRAKEYAERVLAGIDFSDSPVSVLDDRSLLACFRYLPNVKIWRLQLEDVTDLSSDLRDAPAMRQLWAEGSFEDLSSVANYANSLEDITLWSSGQVRHLDIFESLPLLEALRIGFDSLEDVSFLRQLPQLTMLWLSYLDRIANLSVLETLTQLHTLRLGSIFKVPPIDFIKNMREVKSFQLYAPAPASLLSALSSHAPWLKTLDVIDEPKSMLDTIEGLTGFENLETLRIRTRSIINISSLAELPSLSTLELSCSEVTGLSAISAARNLRKIELELDVFDPTDFNLLDELSAEIVVSDKYGNAYRRGNHRAVE